MRLAMAMLLLATACNPITPLKADGGDAGAEDAGSDAGTTISDAGLSGSVFVEPLLEARSRLGARSVAAFRPWRGGIAVARSIGSRAASLPASIECRWVGAAAACVPSASPP